MQDLGPGGALAYAWLRTVSLSCKPCSAGYPGLSPRQVTQPGHVGLPFAMCFLESVVSLTAPGPLSPIMLPGHLASVWPSGEEREKDSDDYTEDGSPVRVRGQGADTGRALSEVSQKRPDATANDRAHNDSNCHSDLSLRLRCGTL